MNVSKINNYNIELDRIERSNVQYKREEDYKKVIERKNLDRIILDRIEKNIRLDRDKGRYIDVDVWRYNNTDCRYSNSGRNSNMGYE